MRCVWCFYLIVSFHLLLLRLLGAAAVRFAKYNLFIYFPTSSSSSSCSSSFATFFCSSLYFTFLFVMQFEFLPYFSTIISMRMYCHLNVTIRIMNWHLGLVAMLNRSLIDFHVQNGKSMRILSLAWKLFRSRWMRAVSLFEHDLQTNLCWFIPKQISPYIHTHIYKSISQQINDKLCRFDCEKLAFFSQNQMNITLFIIIVINNNWMDW